jgi:hypothetical protein
LGAAIVDIKVARITGSRRQCVTQHQNCPSLSQGIPGFFVILSSGNVETQSHSQKNG